MKIDCYLQILEVKTNFYSNRRPWPLSLLALRQVVRILEIKRDHRCDTVLKCENIRRGNKNFQSDQQQRTINDQELGNGFSSNKNLRNLLSKHVKPKKIHEIDVMAEVKAPRDAFCALLSNSSSSKCNKE